MSLTPTQVRVAMQPLVRRIRAGWNVLGFDGVAPDVGRITVAGPLGGTVSIELPITLLVLVPLDAFVADAQSRLRTALRPFEGDFGRGFDKTGRSTLAVGSRGYSANDGWV